MLTQTIAILASSFIFSASLYFLLSKRLKKVEKHTKTLSKEKLLNDFLNDFNLSIKRFLDENHFVMCQDQEFINSNNISSYEEIFDKKFYRISESRRYTNYISGILQEILSNEIIKNKHQISIVEKEVHTKKDIGNGQRDLIINFKHGLFNINIEIKRNDPSIKFDINKNSITTCRNFSKDRLRLLSDLQELTFTQNNTNKKEEDIYLFLYFETIGNNGVYNYPQLKDLSGFAYSAKEPREERIYNNLTLNELTTNIDNFFNSKQNDIFDIKCLDELNQKDYRYCQNIFNYNKKLSINDLNIIQKEKSKLGIFAPCEVEFKSILIGRIL